MTYLREFRWLQVEWQQADLKFFLAVLIAVGDKMAPPTVGSSSKSSSKFCSTNESTSKWTTL